MPRAKGGFKTRRRRKNILEKAKGYYSSKSRLFRIAKQAVDRSLLYAYRDRKVRKREFRALWIIRINAALRALGFTYSKFMPRLIKANIAFIRLFLSAIAYSELSAINQIAEEELKQRETLLKTEAHKRLIVSEAIDITLPGKFTPFGREHPINKVLSEITRIFVSMGFEVAEGPEVELDYYNFEALNIPKDHPARDMQDTFYISDDVIMR